VIEETKNERLYQQSVG